VCPNYDLCDDCKQKEVMSGEHLASHSMQMIGPEDQTGNILYVKTLDMWNTVMNTNKLIVVDFIAKWYQPCRHFIPNFAYMSLEYPSVVFVSIDIDEAKDIATIENIRNPAIKFYKEKKPVKDISSPSALSNLAELVQILRYELESLGAVKTKIVEAKKKPKKVLQDPSNVLEKPSLNSTPQLTLIQPEKKNPFKYFPKTDYLSWQTANFDAVLKKIMEFNEKMAAESTTKQLGLSSDEFKNVQTMVSTLTQDTKYHISNFSSIEYQCFEKLLLWSDDFLFPVLDLFRLLVLHPDASIYFGKQNSAIAESLKHLSKDAKYANQLMTLRLLSNLFLRQSTKAVAINMASKIIDSTKDLIQSTNKNIQIGLSTLYLNYCVALANELKEQNSVKHSVVHYLLQVC